MAGLGTRVGLVAATSATAGAGGRERTRTKRRVTFSGGAKCAFELTRDLSTFQESRDCRVALMDIDADHLRQMVDDPAVENKDYMQDWA